MESPLTKTCQVLLPYKPHESIITAFSSLTYSPDASELGRMSFNSSSQIIIVKLHKMR